MPKKKRGAKKPQFDLPPELAAMLEEMPELGALVDRVPPEQVLVGGMIAGFVKAHLTLMERQTVALEIIAKELQLPRSEH